MNKILISMVLVSLLFVVGCTVECPDCICPEQKECAEPEVCEEVTECQIDDNMAIIDADMYTWGFNEDNHNELLFDFWVTNYGNSEAKNIKVKCRLNDVNNNVVATVDHSFGNLASHSSELAEAVGNKGTANMYSEYSALCYVKSCTNCDILYKRNSELVDHFEAT